MQLGQNKGASHAGGDSEEAPGGLRLDVGLHSGGASAKMPFDFPIHLDGS
jgi:hypothetical protein